MQKDTKKENKNSMTSEEEGKRECKWGDRYKDWESQIVCVGGWLNRGRERQQNKAVREKERERESKRDKKAGHTPYPASGGCWSECSYFLFLFLSLFIFKKIF